MQAPLRGLTPANSQIACSIQCSNLAQVVVIRPILTRVDSYGSRPIRFVMAGLMPRKDDEQYSEAETERRREAALKRMLSTPHKPHKPLGKKNESRQSLNAEKNLS